jgi:hypothetical protein
MASPRPLRVLSACGFTAIVALFVACSFALIAFAGIELWSALDPRDGAALANRFNAVRTSIAMLTIAMAAMELADTVAKEEFKPEPRLSMQARIRRVLSRFLVVIIVSLAIESLVAVFKMVHDDPANISAAAFIAFAAAALLGAWGLFSRWDKGRDAGSDDPCAH